MSLHQNILSILSASGEPFATFDHTATDTCESSAAMRHSLAIDGAGSKNICFHAKGQFYLVVTLASKEIKARAFKKPFGTKDIRFASADELATQVGAPFGCVPPFGFESVSLPIFVDADIFSQAFFLFNPAIATQTIQIAPKSLLALYQKIPQKVVIFKKISEEEGLEFIPLSEFVL